MNATEIVVIWKTAEKSIYIRFESGEFTLEKLRAKIPDLSSDGKIFYQGTMIL
jgi:hypothetical protein